MVFFCGAPMHRKAIKKTGFTLIELLLVIGIIGILAAIVIIAINPSAQLQDAKDAKRRSDLRAIADAVYQYLIDTKSLPLGSTGAPIISGNEREICNSSIADAFVCNVIEGGNWLYPLSCTEALDPNCKNYLVD